MSLVLLQKKLMYLQVRQIMESTALVPKSGFWSGVLDLRVHLNITDAEINYFLLLIDNGDILINNEQEREWYTYSD